MNEILAINRPAAPAGAPDSGPPQEIEIKLAAAPAMLETLRHHPLLGQAAPRVAQTSIYFDTPAQALAAGGASLRLRRRAGACEQTLKLNGAGDKHGRGPVTRGEWNQPLPGEATRPDPNAFPPLAARALTAMLGTAPLAPFGEVAVEREARLVHHGASRIELAFDTGIISAPDRAPLALAELELELREGRMADLFALALELPLGPDLRWSLATKAQRARNLGCDPTPLHAQGLHMEAGINARRGFQAIGWACLTQLVGNAALVTEGEEGCPVHPGAIHQARVAIRRLRAAMALFARPLLRGDAEAKTLREALREAGLALGPARDLHVLRAHLEAMNPTDTLAARLLARLRAAETAATMHARMVLAAPAFQRLLPRLALWLEAGRWTGAAAGETPLAAMGGALLHRQRKRIKGVRRQLFALGTAALHDLRIEVKKLRYAVDFLAPTAADPLAANAHMRALGQVQDTLGALHDRAEAEATLALACHGPWLPPLPAREAKDYARRLRALLAAHSEPRTELIAHARHALAREKAHAGWWT